MLIRNTAAAAWLAAALTAGLSSTSGAATPPRAPAVAELLKRDLAGDPDREVVMLTVTYPAAGSSLPHRHDAQVFVYVLEGTLIMQVRGGPATTLRAGDTFYEAPGDVHVVSANASKRSPAKFLVVMIKDKHKPASQPVAD